MIYVHEEYIPASLLCNILRLPASALLEINNTVTDPDPDPQTNGTSQQGGFFDFLNTYHFSIGPLNKCWKLLDFGFACFIVDNYSPLSLMWGVIDSVYKWYRESPTELILADSTHLWCRESLIHFFVITGSRLLNFFNSNSSYCQCGVLQSMIWSRFITFEWFPMY